MKHAWKFLIPISIVAFLWCCSYLLFMAAWDNHVEIIEFASTHKAVIVACAAPFVFFIAVIMNN